MGPPVEGPHRNPVAPPRSCQWVNALRHNSICSGILRKLPDDELPCHESSKMFFGAASTSAPPYKAILHHLQVGMCCNRVVFFGWV